MTGVKKLSTTILLATIITSCGSNKGMEPLDMLSIGDSITTIDGISYYWLNMAEDSAKISAVIAGKIIKECIITGPTEGVGLVEGNNRFFYILGKGHHELFDTQNIPDEINFLTEDDL